MPNRRGVRGQRQAEDEQLHALLQRLATEDRVAFDALVKLLERICPTDPRDSKKVYNS